MLKRFENDTTIHHGDTEDEAAVIDALTQALQHAKSREEQANIQLAIELRKHLAEERHDYVHEREELEAKWQQARDSHQRSAESLQRDTQRIGQPVSIMGVGRLALQGKRSTTVRGDAKQSAEFSRLMLRSAENKVIQASEALRALDLRFEKTLKRREVEFRLAFVACESVLRRYTASSNGSASMPKSTSSIANPPAVQLPTRSLPMLPQPSRGPRMPKVPTTSRSTPALLLPPPPPPPPPPPQPQPLLPAPTGALPFTITTDSSSETPQTQFRIQRRIPRKHLFPFPENMAAQLGADVMEEDDGCGFSGAKVKQLVVGPLCTCICGALKASIPGIGYADIVEGMAGFGADAYLVVKDKEQKEVLRLPVSTVSTFSRRSPKPLAGQQQQQLSDNQRAMRKSLLLAKGCDPHLAETAVKRIVQLISTETMACNAGLLVSAEGILLVRRTTVQAALVSKMALFGGAASADPNACHPVAVVVWFVAGLLEKIKRQGDSNPRKILAPPLLF
ncbi:hypothetical protein GGI23_000264 [Coemansia sp. RSA 2559]|nr:hypothetical protein GGI23_000264 [Coemansia sp. RSA 2559]KAJ2869471.1 hypothetical protein GGI22_000237 [Coemansia erecta]